MDGNRFFIVGVIALLLGIQFLVVESFDLNEWASTIVNKRFPSDTADPATSYVSQGPYNDPWLTSPGLTPSRTRHVTHPRQLAFSFISVGAILIFVSPVYRK